MRRQHAGEFTNFQASPTSSCLMTSIRLYGASGEMANCAAPELLSDSVLPGNWSDAAARVAVDFATSSVAANTQIFDIGGKKKKV